MGDLSPLPFTAYIERYVVIPAIQLFCCLVICVCAANSMLFSEYSLFLRLNISNPFMAMFVYILFVELHWESSVVVILWSYIVVPFYLSWKTFILLAILNDNFAS
jgi:hypothetical protein